MLHSNYQSAASNCVFKWRGTGGGGRIKREGDEGFQLWPELGENLEKNYGKLCHILQ